MSDPEVAAALDGTATIFAVPAEEVQDEYLAAGFNGYLEKPVIPPMLQKLISEL